ncbi:ABC transporter permease subunit [Leucobacter sp. UCMA 4100]|uniref:ABC transporter permease n=1 Tax=Leucobacter sp. UCMA 4100 TaxID=2810534 RepID=UPI0022EA14E0|nr:ABC transporter permease subunit [Leucobacter sp. UCMA 4100]MDA3146660.1 ABC transporter permease subunit [Leucobacter sp. UCMA 4100]
MNIPKIPIGTWGQVVFDWFRDTFDWLIDFFKVFIDVLVNGIVDGLLSVHFLVVIVLFAALGWLVRSWQLAVGTIISLLLIVSMGYWQSAMQTLGLVLVATLIAVVMAIPLGILAAKSDRFSAFMKPLLDFLQTMPAFVYLVPAVLLFSIGFVPAIFATVIFAIAPGVRFTELGIRGVDGEVVEAGQAFGAKPGQILRGIQLPLALPTIMAGINQVIMLSLSMAVLGGFVGAPGLGKDVVAAVMQQQLPAGIESGVSIVIIAVFLDRVTAALGNQSEYQSSLLGLFRKRKADAKKA